MDDLAEEKTTSSTSSDYQTLVDELRKMNLDMQRFREDVGKTTQGLLSRFEILQEEFHSSRSGTQTPSPSDLAEPKESKIEGELKEHKPGAILYGFKPPRLGAAAIEQQSGSEPPAAGDVDNHIWPPAKNLFGNQPDFTPIPSNQLGKGSRQPRSAMVNRVVRERQQSTGLITAAGLSLNQQRGQRTNIAVQPTTTIPGAPVPASVPPSASTGTATNITVQVEQAPYQKIPERKEVVSINDALLLFDEYYEAKTRLGSRITLSMMIGRITTNLLTQTAQKIWGVQMLQQLTTSNGVLQCNDDDIIVLLALRFQPKKHTDFGKLFTENLKFPMHLLGPGSFQLSTATFGTFFTALLEYRRMFLNFNTFVLRGIHEDDFDKILPPLNNKANPKGYYYLFVEKIPFEFGVEIFNSYPNAEWKHFKTIEEFLDNVYDGFLSEQYEKHLEYVRDRDIYRKSKALPDARSTAPSTSLSAGGPRGGMYVRTPGSFRAEQRQQSLRAIEDVDYDDYERNWNPPDQSEYYEYDGDDVEYTDNPMQLSAIAAADGGSGACFEYMRKDKCVKGAACTYSHKEQDIISQIILEFQKLERLPLFKKTGVRVMYPSGTTSTAQAAAGSARLNAPPSGIPRLTPGSTSYPYRVSAVTAEQPAEAATSTTNA